MFTAVGLWHIAGPYSYLLNEWSKYNWAVAEVAREQWDLTEFGRAWEQSQV